MRIHPWEECDLYSMICKTNVYIFRPFGPGKYTRRIKFSCLTVYISHILVYTMLYSTILTEESENANLKKIKKSFKPQKNQIKIKINQIFSARQHMLSTLYAITRPSVRHTGGSVENG